MSTGELRHQRRSRNEQHGVTGVDRLPANRHRKMRFADPRWTQQHHRLAVGREPAAGQIPYLTAIDRGLRREVEPAKIAGERKPRQADRHLNPPAVLARDLALAQQRQALADRQFAP